MYSADPANVPVKASQPSHIEEAEKFAAHLSNYSPSHRADMLSVIGTKLIEYAQREIVDLKGEGERLQDQVLSRQGLIDFAQRLQQSVVGPKMSGGY